MTKAKWILLGLGLLVAAVVVGTIPRSASYSDFGLGLSGAVDVECGSVFSRDQFANFHDLDEGRQYRADKTFGEPRIFDGQTETEVCDDLISDTLPWVIVLFVVGGGALIFGLTRPGSTSTSTAGSSVGRVLVGPAGGAGGTSGVGAVTDESVDDTAGEPAIAVDVDRATSASTDEPDVLVNDAAFVAGPRSDALDRPPTDDIGLRPDTPDRPPTDDIGLRPDTPDVLANDATLDPELRPDTPDQPVPGSEYTPSIDAVPIVTPSDDARVEETRDRADVARFSIDRLLVIGRDPTASHEDGAHDLHRIADDMLLSKTHLAVGREPDGRLWVEDRHSTNGVWIRRDGDDTRTRPGRRIPLASGDEIRFGAQTLAVVERAGGLALEPMDPPATNRA